MNVTPTFPLLHGPPAWEPRTDEWGKKDTDHCAGPSHRLIPGGARDDEQLVAAGPFPPGRRTRTRGSLDASTVGRFPLPYLHVGNPCPQIPAQECGLSPRAVEFSVGVGIDVHGELGRACDYVDTLTSTGPASSSSCTLPSFFLPLPLFSLLPSLPLGYFLPLPLVSTFCVLLPKWYLATGFQALITLV